MKKVLILDDSRLQRSIMSTIIKSSDSFIVCGEAENGILGLDLVDEKDPDVILLDMNMPRMDGFAFLEVMNDSKSKAKIIVISAVAHSFNVEKAKELGAAHYFMKPVRPLRLIQVMKSLFKNEEK